MTLRRLRARRKYRDRRDGERYALHTRGICGDEVASLCHECYQDELEYMRTWAGFQPVPRPGETPEIYWRRIGGAFWDCWYRVAQERIKEVR